MTKTEHLHTMRALLIGLVMFVGMLVAPIAASAYYPALSRGDSVGLPIRFGVQLYSTQNGAGSGDIDTSNYDYTTQGANLVSPTIGANVWSDWAYIGHMGMGASKVVNPQSARIFFYVPQSVASITQDFRLCAQMAGTSPEAYTPGKTYTLNESTIGDVSCTPWMSDGGGQSAPVKAVNHEIGDYTRVMLETRPLPAHKKGISVPRIRAGIQVLTTAGQCNSMTSGPTTSSGNPSNTFWFDRGGVYNQGGSMYSTYAGSPMRCYRLYLTPFMTEPPAISPGEAAIGIQAFRSDNKTPGDAVYSKGSWSSWASAPDTADIDRARILLQFTPSETNRKDFRFCLRVANTADESKAGNTNNWVNPGPACTAWASDAANNPDYDWPSPLAHAINGTKDYGQGPVVKLQADPNYLQIRVETRPMPGDFYLTDLKLGLQAGNGGNGQAPYPLLWPELGPYCIPDGAVASTGWASGNPGWSTWATNSSDNEPDCYRLLLTAKKAPISGNPTATIQSIAYNTELTAISQGTPLTIRWSSQNATSCTGTGPNFSTGGATSGEVTFSNLAVGNYTYTVSCTGASGSQSWQEYNPGDPVSMGASWCSNNPSGQNFNCPSMNVAGTGCPALNATCQVIQNVSSGGMCLGDVQYYRCIQNEAQAQVTVTVEPLYQEESSRNLTATTNAPSFDSYDGPITLSGSIRNTGSSDVILSGSGDMYHVIEICNQDTYWCSQGWIYDSISVMTNTLPAGQARSVSGQITLPDPTEDNVTYSFRICADPEDYVSESNENDNCSPWTYLTPSAKLSLSVNPFIVKSGGSAVFTWSAENVQQNVCRIVSEGTNGVQSPNLNPTGQTSGTWTATNLTARRNWYLRCWDLTDSQVETERVEVRILPGVSEF